MACGTGRGGEPEVGQPTSGRKKVVSPRCNSGCEHAAEDACGAGSFGAKRQWSRRPPRRARLCEVGYVFAPTRCRRFRQVP